MSKALLQSALARIYLDEAVRQELARGERSALADLGLPAADEDRLIELVRRHRSGLELFAQLLDAKQSAVVRARMPLTLAVAGEEAWQEAWTTWRRSARAEGAVVPSAAAARLAAVLLDRLARQGLDGSPAAEVIAYERCKLLIRSGPSPVSGPSSSRPRQEGSAGGRCPLVHRPFVVERFQHNVIQAVAAVRAGRQPPSSQQAHSLLLVFYCHWQTGGVRVAKATPAVARLLECCDGVTTTTAIAASFSNDGATGQGELAGCERALAALSLAGAVIFTASGKQGAHDGEHGD